MATSYSPKTITSGLVTLLDVANIKSFKGEPTTNVVTNTNLDTGWSKDYQTNIVFNEILPPDGIISPVVGFDRGATSGYWYSYGNFAPQVPNTIYTVSMYVKTLDSNFNIRYYTADNSEVGRVWGPFILVPNDGKWYRIIWSSFTNPSNSQSDSLSFNFTYAGSIGSPSTRTWFCAPQMEAKTYATPFVIGTRGTTVETGGGLFDMTYNSKNGQLFGTTYNSDNLGSLDFDGTDDYYTIPQPGITTSPNEWTISLWINPGNQLSRFITPQSNGVDQYLTYDPTNQRVRINVATSADTNERVRSMNTNTVPRDKWTFLTISLDNLTIKMYSNGILINTFTETLSIGNWTSTWVVGQRGNATNWYLGKMSNLMVHNRALSDDEILQNYNSTKSRYGL